MTMRRYKLSGDNKVHRTRVRVFPGMVLYGKRVVWIGGGKGQPMSKKREQHARIKKEPKSSEHVWQELQDKGWANWTKKDLPVLLELARWHRNGGNFRGRILAFIHPGGISSARFQNSSC